METFIRKLFAFVAILGLLAIAGCATTNETRKAEADAQVAIGNARVAEAQAAAEDAKAVQALAVKASSQGADNALLLRALKGMGLGHSPVQQVVQQAPPSALGIAWQTLLQVADVALRGYGIKASRDVNLATSNNNRDVSIAGYNAFTSMGAQIQAAGTAGYQYVQAPQPNQTINGNGVIGSGTFSAPTTTTTTTTTNRNCSGGSGAAGGGTDTGGAGGGGGSASGGSC